MLGRLVNFLLGLMIVGGGECWSVVNVAFLWDPSLIIGYACQWLTHSLTTRLPFSKLNWCEPGMWRWQLKTFIGPESDHWLCLFYFYCQPLILSQHTGIHFNVVAPKAWEACSVSPAPALNHLFLGRTSKKTQPLNHSIAIHFQKVLEPLPHQTKSYIVSWYTQNMLG